MRVHNAPKEISITAKYALKNCFANSVYVFVVLKIEHRLSKAATKPTNPVWTRNLSIEICNKKYSKIWIAKARERKRIKGKKRNEFRNVEKKRTKHLYCNWTRLKCNCSTFLDYFDRFIIKWKSNLAFKMEWTKNLKSVQQQPATITKQI